jgi:hypothetical protein
MNDIAGSQLPQRREMGDGAAASFSAQEGRSRMINGFTLHDTTTTPAASAEILNGIQKGWASCPTCTASSLYLLKQDVLRVAQHEPDAQRSN